MDLKNALKNIIPNPSSNQSTLFDLAKKEELLKEVAGFKAIYNKIVFLIIASFVLVYFKFSISIIAILIGVEALIIVADGYIKVKKIKIINSIKAQDNAQDYSAVLTTREYYELIRAIFALITSAISVFLILTFFSHEISNFFIQNFNSLQLRSVKYVILIVVISRLFDFIVSLIRYEFVKNLKTSNDIAQVNQGYALINEKVKLISFCPIFSVALLILYFIGIPLFIILFFGSFMFLMIVLSVITLKRIKNLSFDYNKIDTSVVQHNILEYQGEQISGSVFGIIRSSGWKKPFGVTYLGVGKVYYPENTLLITNYRLVMIQVLVTGGNKVFDEVDYTSTNIFFNRGEIRQKGEDLLKNNSLSQVLQFATNDILYNDIKTLTLKKSLIVIKKTNGEKLSYGFMDKEYVDLLKQLFQVYLKDRFIIA